MGEEFGYVKIDGLVLSRSCSLWSDRIGPQSGSKQHSGETFKDLAERRREKEDRTLVRSILKKDWTCVTKRP